MKAPPHRLEQFDDYWIAKDDHGYGNALCLKTSWANRFLTLIAKRRIKIIRLNEHIGWLDSDISFLNEIPGLRGVDILSARVTDVSPVFRLKQLKTLSLYCKAKTAGNFAKLEKLQRVGLDWRNVYESVFGLDGLTRIHILSYPNGDLTHWKRNVHLKELLLSSNRMERLSGIERFPNINLLDLFRCRKLGSLDAISSATSIQKLRLDQCTGVLDLSPISHLTELRELEIENCHDIKSLAPVAKCKNLERLQIAGNTTILSGDFNPLRKLTKLRKVLLANRKHYSHTADCLESKPSPVFDGTRS